MTKKRITLADQVWLLKEQQVELARNVMILDQNFNTLLELYKKSIAPKVDIAVKEED